MNLSLLLDMAAAGHGDRVAFGPHAGGITFSSAETGDCVLTATPPYHIAAVASILSNLYAGRRVVYLPDFDAAEWLRLVREERVTSAMVVPTMLSRIVDHLDGKPANAPSLRLLSYGGSRAAPSVVEAAIAAFPGTGELREWARTRLRGSRTPDDIRWLDELPYSPTGKLLRRDVATALTGAASQPGQDGAGQDGAGQDGTGQDGTGE
jgi:acyl-CoA synthetase (AMP-forming)/AMP-acid ligase II